MVSGTHFLIQIEPLQIVSVTCFLFTIVLDGDWYKLYMHCTIVLDTGMCEIQNIFVLFLVMEHVPYAACVQFKKDTIVQ